jgi:hypothetical protein
VPELGADSPAIAAGPLTLKHASGHWGDFTLSVANHVVATGHNRPMIGYLDPARTGKEARAPVRWVDVAKVATFSTINNPDDRSLQVEVRFVDPDGGRWQLRQVFGPRAPGAIGLKSACSVDVPRDVVFLPLLLVVPGQGSFGALKGQALFAGVEYLENEPSSSTADLNGPGANRRVPASAKITFPLMAVQAHGDYVGLIWERAAELCALFDSPDRVFGTEGHVLGLLAPGAESGNRIDGELLPLEPLKLAAGRPVTASATIIGGQGESVVPAVMQYVALQGLPQRPGTLDLPDYVRLAAAGGSTRRSARATASATRSVDPSALIRPPMPPG